MAGAATSDPTAATNTLGKYCWRTQYAPDLASTGVFAAAAHTNSTSECFSVGAVAPGLPDTGAPQPQTAPQPGLRAVAAIVITAVLLLAVVWRASRTVAVLVIAGLVAGSSPSSPALSQPSRVTMQSLEMVSRVPGHRSITPTAPASVTPGHMEVPGWRLQIPAIGVDAPIEAVGLDAHRAMAAPSNLETVGWFNRGPAPGYLGDAVIDGHYGLPWDPAVFRNLDRLRPGDTLQVIWPDGRRLQFRIQTVANVSANSPPPPDLFTHTGPARLSLITCGGQWVQSQRTYNERLIVTAVLAS